MTAAVPSSTFSDVLAGSIGGRRLSSGRLNCVLSPYALPVRGMCCTNHLNLPCGCGVINLSGLVGVASGSSSKTMIEGWSCGGEGSVTTVFPFLNTYCPVVSSASAASCSWNSNSKSSSASSTWASIVAPSSSSEGVST